MPVKKLKEFLDTYHVKYVTITHSVAYTAQGIAALTHIPGKDLAKTVILKIDGEFAMAVVPASVHVDLRALKAISGAKEVLLATEHDFKSHFPDCETGAMPPFGNLYGMKVYVDELLQHDIEIAFNAGSHRELIRLAYEDYSRLVNPVVMKCATKAAITAA